jgi:hypothetical protein
MAAAPETRITGAELARNLHPLTRESLRESDHSRSIKDNRGLRAVAIGCINCQEVSTFRVKCVAVLIEALVRSNTTHPDMAGMFTDFCMCVLGETPLYVICNVKIVCNESWRLYAKNSESSLFAGVYSYNEDCRCGCKIWGKREIANLLTRDWAAIEPSPRFNSSVSFIGKFVCKCNNCGTVCIRSRCIEEFERKLHRENCAAGTIHMYVSMYCMQCHGESFTNIAVPYNKDLCDAVEWPARCPCGCEKTEYERDCTYGCSCTFHDDD